MIVYSRDYPDPESVEFGLGERLKVLHWEIKEITVSDGLQTGRMIRGYAICQKSSGEIDVFPADQLTVKVDGLKTNEE